MKLFIILIFKKKWKAYSKRKLEQILLPMLAVLAQGCWINLVIYDRGCFVLSPKHVYFYADHLEIIYLKILATSVMLIVSIPNDAI